MKYIRKIVDHSFFGTLASSCSVLSSSVRVLPKIKTPLRETFTHPTRHTKSWLLSHHYALPRRSHFYNTSNEVSLFHLQNCILTQPNSEIVVDERISWESFHGRHEYEKYLFSQDDLCYHFFYSKSSIDHASLKYPLFILPTRWYQSNYYHWVVESIPRIFYFKKLQKDHPELKLALHRFSENSYQAQWLRLLDVANSDCYFIDSEHNHRFSNVFYVPILGSGHVSKATISCLLSLLNNSFIPERHLFEISPYIFIDRKPGTVRSIANTSQIHKLLLKRGFSILYLEDLPVATQLSCIHSATRIVGIHGSGFANLVAVQPHASILEIMTATMINPCFYDLSAALRANYGFIASPYSSLHSASQHLIVNPTLLEDSIDLMSE